MEELVKIAVGSPSGMVGLAIIALAVIGGGSFLFLRKVARDQDGLGGKVNRIDTQQQRDQDRFARIESDHGKLEREFRAAQEKLPDQLKDARHEVIKHMSPSIEGLDERLDNLRDDVRDMKRERSQ